MTRCLYCHGDLGGPTATCAECGTVLHADCFTEHGRCVVPGCESHLVATPSDKPPRRPRSFAMPFALAGILLGATGAACLALACSPPRAKSRVRSDCATIAKAMTLFKIDEGRYPRSMSELWLKPSSDRAWRGPYVDADPRDPWGDPYELVWEGDRAFVAVSSGDGGVLLLSGSRP